jgi:hypothetical protein
MLNGVCSWYYVVNKIHTNHEISLQKPAIQPYYKALEFSLYIVQYFCKICYNPITLNSYKLSLSLRFSGYDLITLIISVCALHIVFNLITITLLAYEYIYT